jgi:chromosome partitioning protein
MKVVSIINYKGGVGKTALTTNLAGELAWRGKNVLMIDLDAQASLTFSFITPDAWAKDFADSATIKSWFDAFDTGTPLPLAELVYRPERISNILSKHGKLSMIFSHLGLINVDLELATKLGGASLVQAKRNFIAIHRRLLEGLATLDDTYDVILIDCPPNFNIVTKTAIIASDFILVPARPDYLSTLGIDYLMRSVNDLIDDYNDYANLDQGIHVDTIDPKVLGVVFTMIQEYAGGPISAQRTFMNQVRARGELSVFEGYIKRNDTLFADAPQTGIPVVLRGYASGSHQSVVDGLENVTNEFASRLGI